MKRPLLNEGAWQHAYERALIFLTALAGMSIGLGILIISPPGFDGTDLVAWLALGVGVAASAALLLGHTNPIPFFIVIVVLVGLTGPFVDSTMAMALSTILISVLATGSLLIQESRRLAGFMLLTTVALALRPVLDFVGVSPIAAATTPVAIPWLVALITLVVTALGFRALRDQMVSKDAHQESMNELVSSLAHHIRTPLTAAIGFSYLLRAELSEGDARDYADGVTRRGWEISQGLDDLIIIARSDVESLEVLKRPVDLSMAVNRVLDQVPGARVKLRYMSVNAYAIGDPERVRHVVRHLVRNAVIHGGPGLTIHSRVTELNAELHLNDDGDPLSEEDLRLVFEPFYRRPGSSGRLGRGVGLTVSRILARAMGGDIVLTSGHGGNTAVLSLPADPRRAASVAPGQLLRSHQAPGQPV